MRLAEAFISNETATGMRASVDRLRGVEATLLGVRAQPGPEVAFETSDG